MPRRFIRPATTLFFLLAVATLLSPQKLLAQTIEGGWQAYYGCWQPVAAPGSSSRAGAPGAALCIIPDVAGNAVSLVSVSGDSVTSRVRVAANGLRTEVSRDGCSGWESAERGTAGRMHLRSDYICEGGVRRTASSLLAFVGTDEWMDVQVVAVDGRSSSLLQRYREAVAPAAVRDEVEAAMRNRGLAIATARIAAGSAINLPDIVDASRRSDPLTVEAWLLERRQGYFLKRDHLEYLADSGVPSETIDLVVALSHPDAFASELSRRRLAMYPASSAVVNSARVASPDYVVPPSQNYNTPVDRAYMDRHYYGGYGELYGGYFYSPFGFYYPGAAGFFGAPYVRTQRPVVVIIKEGSNGGGGGTGGGGDPPDGGAIDPARMIRGQGYTNGLQAPGGAAQSANDASSAGQSSNAGAVMSGYTGGAAANQPPASATSNSGGGAASRNSGGGSAGGRSQAAPPPARTAQPRNNSAGSATSGSTASGSSSSAPAKSTTSGSGSAGSSKAASPPAPAKAASGNGKAVQTTGGKSGSGGATD